MTTDLVAGLMREGFVVLKQAVPHTDIDRHLAAIDGIAGVTDMWRLPAGYSKEQLENHRRLRAEFFTRDTTHLALTGVRPLRAFAETWFGEECVTLSGGTHLYSLGSHIHSDTLNTATTENPDHLLRFWCALEDISPQSGPIRFYPGTHRSISAVIREQILADSPGYRAMLGRHLSAPTDDDRVTRPQEWLAFYRHITRMVTDRLQEMRLDPVTPSLNKGDVVAFIPSVVHESAPCEDASLTRKAHLFSVFARSARWYGPRAYWGALHDHRSPANRMTHTIEDSPFGLRATNHPAAQQWADRVAVSPVGPDRSSQAAPANG